MTPQEVAEVRVEDPYRIVRLADGTELGCHALMITTGVSYRRLDVPGAERLTGLGIYYGAATTEAFESDDEDVYIIGGANSAGQAAVYFLDPLEQGDKEDDLPDRLEERGVEDAWELAPTLVAAGVDAESLEELRVEDEVLEVAVEWLGATLSLAGLADEMEKSVGRISELVGAMKEYSYMDKASYQEVDVHKGLESTLTMLTHKLKKGVEVVQDYDRSLPRICAHGGELNQAWTNLLDNAIDAMEGEGRLRIRTSRDGGCVHVEITDSGPGVPKEFRNRIFEPFFTTKDVGEGTGLGLDIVRRIVVGRHGGDIRVDSEPGETRFTVRLPLDPRETNGG